MKKIILSISVITAFKQSSFAQFNWSSAGNSVTNNTHYLGSTNSAHLDFRTAATQRMRITSGGLVGIGSTFLTTMPQAALHVHSTTGLSLKLETTGANNADLAFQSGSNQSDILTYNSSGVLSSLLRFNNTGLGTSLTYTSYVSGSPTDFFRCTEAGRFGIGTITPSARLHVEDDGTTTLDSRLRGFTLIDGFQASLLLGQTTAAPYGEWGLEYNTLKGGLNFWKPGGATTGTGNYYLFISNAGNVSIGTENSFGYKFAVKGNMIAEQVVVKLYGTWPDFVFAKNYKPLSLYEVEKYINENNHLPNVPAAKEVEEKGIDVGEMNKILLQKIEEMTLYMIDQQKQIDELKAKLK